MRRPVAWGTKEKDGAMPTPDYLPSFMEVGVVGWMCVGIGWVESIIAPAP